MPLEILQAVLREIIDLVVMHPTQKAALLAKVHFDDPSAYVAPPAAEAAPADAPAPETPEQEAARLTARLAELQGPQA